MELRQMPRRPLTRRPGGPAAARTVVLGLNAQRDAQAAASARRPKAQIDFIDESLALQRSHP